MTAYHERCSFFLFLKNTVFNTLIILFLSFFSLASVFSLENEQGKQGWLDALLEKVGSGDEYNPEKLIDFGVLPGPFYTPEMKLGIGIAAIGLYKTNRYDEEERISTLSINGFGSVSKAYGVNVENNSFFKHDRFRLFIDAMFYDAPEKYWGIGYEQNSNDDLGEDYTNDTISVEPRFYVIFLKGMYLGIGGSWIRDNAKDTEPDGLFYQDNPHGTTVNSCGISLHVMSDTRDFIPNPYEGHLLEFDYYSYDEVFGSDSEYSVTKLTACKYWAVYRNNIIAVQGHLSSCDGDVPWSQLSFIGGKGQMRGYWMGRYRDKRMITCQLEYRHDLPGRHGFTIWGGAGMIAPEFDEMDKDEILPNGGIGYRFAFKYRSNVRLDLGFGKNGEMGTYFNVNEAF